jgi:hypothetical protein
MTKTKPKQRPRVAHVFEDDSPPGADLLPRRREQRRGRLGRLGLDRRSRHRPILILDMPRAERLP